MTGEFFALYDITTRLIVHNLIYGVMVCICLGLAVRFIRGV